jgi:hypothetical protein
MAPRLAFVSRQGRSVEASVFIAGIIVAVALALLVVLAHARRPV